MRHAQPDCIRVILEDFEHGIAMLHLICTYCPDFPASFTRVNEALFGDGYGYEVREQPFP